MKRYGILIVPALAAGLLAACQSTSAGEDTLAASRVSGTDTLGLARRACGECHAVERGGLSHNATAPTFQSVANRRGTTLASLTNWLRNAHNYPDEMNFALTEDEEGELASYILSLRDEEFASPIR